MSSIKRPSFTQEEALAFHAGHKPGKLEITPTKPMATQRDLSLAYSPGVAVPVRAIAERPDAAYDYTAKGNLVAVISNGTAILGLGDLGALASKPVMEGKAVLFKRFADVDSIDLEVDTSDVDEFIAAVRSLDRVLMSGFYVVPLYHLPAQWVARWTTIAHPPETSLFGYLPETWWREPAR